MITTHRARKTILASVLALSAIATAACSDSSSSSNPETTAAEAQTTSVAPESEQAAPTSPATPDATAAPAPAATTAAQAAPAPNANLPELKDASADQKDIGGRFTVMGVPAASCVFGDGFGTHVWAANDNTSCDFVVEVGEALTEGLNGTTDNIRDHLKPTITATSPLTGEQYTMNCENVDVYVRCTGGNNAGVYFL